MGFCPTVGGFSPSKMTKQEEIREGIDDLLKDVFRCFKRGEWIDTATVTRKIQEFESSKGVVIKVDRYFPKKEAGQDNIQYCAGWYDCFHKAMEAGYVATEPLVKDD